MKLNFNLPENTEFIINTLAENGYEAYIVGGCVRDLIMNIPPHDWDICTNALPDEVITVFKDFRTVQSGIKHGTVGIVIEHLVYEVTTFRSETGYSDNRHPDGVHFEKCAGNPVIPTFPPEGSPDFRDPAVCFAEGSYWCVMASGNRERNAAVLLLYESGDLLRWQYRGVLREWDNAKFAECPSFVRAGDRYLLAASVCREPVTVLRSECAAKSYPRFWDDLDGLKGAAL